MMRDILDSIASKEIILKIDVEGYECKALQPEILLNKVGKFIPFIFMEWGQLPQNQLTCPQFQDWVKNFYAGGYVPVDPGKLQSPHITDWPNLIGRGPPRLCADWIMMMLTP